MHCIASSLCFWVWTILRETVDSLSHLHHHRAAQLHTAHSSPILLHEERPEALHHPITPLPLTASKCLFYYNKTQNFDCKYNSANNQDLKKNVCSI
jgi:hypothetical protein